MHWACGYTAANRAALLNAVADLLEGISGMRVDPESFVKSPHNTGSVEEPAGELLIVQRKSANYDAAGRARVVAGSMTAGSRITVGHGNPESLASSAHGAGRVMSRFEAGERILARDLEPRMSGIVFRWEWAGRFCGSARLPDCGVGGITSPRRTETCPATNPTSLPRRRFIQTSSSGARCSGVAVT